MEPISNLPEWTKSEESTWKKGTFGFGITFQTQNIAEINKQIADKKFTFSVKIPESNTLTTDLLLGEPDIVLNYAGGPFLPNIYNQSTFDDQVQFFMNINIFGSSKSSNICLTMKDTITNLFYITASSTNSSDNSSILPSMLPVDNDFTIENIEISKFNTQLKFQSQPVFVVGNGSDFNSSLPDTSLLFDIGDDDIPVYLISKTRSDNNRVRCKPNDSSGELDNTQEQFNQSINNISSTILHMDSLVQGGTIRVIRSVVIYYLESNTPKLKFLRVDSGTLSVPASFDEADIPGAIPGVSDIFLLRNDNNTDYRIYLKNDSTNTCQIFSKNTQGTWTATMEVNDGLLLKMNDQVILDQDKITNQLTVFKTFGVPMVGVTPYLVKINEFVADFNTINKIVLLQGSGAVPKIAILASKVTDQASNVPCLLLFNIDFPDLPVPASVGVWNMNTGFIDRTQSDFCIIQSTIEKNNEGELVLKLNTVNRSKIHSYNSNNFSFELEYDKNKHNIGYHHIWNGNIAKSAAHRYGLSPFKYPTINELKSLPYNLKFPDDFNYYSFLGNTYDVGNTSDIRESDGNIGSKLPENLKFYKNFINNSHIINYIAYSAITGDNVIHPIVINSDESISMNPLYSFGNKKYGETDSQYNTVMLMSIGNSKKLDNPFIWFESNAMGLIGIRQEGNIFTNGSRTDQLDHYNNQSLWMGIFPDVIKVEDTQEKSFNDLAPSIWNFDKLNSVEMGDYLEDNEL